MWTTKPDKTAYGIWNEEAYTWLLPIPWQESLTSIDNNQWITFSERDEFENVLDSNYEFITIDGYSDYCNGNLFVII